MKYLNWYDTFIHHQANGISPSTYFCIDLGFNQHLFLYTPQHEKASKSKQYTLDLEWWGWGNWQWHECQEPQPRSRDLPILCAGAGPVISRSQRMGLYSYDALRVWEFYLYRCCVWVGKNLVFWLRQGPIKTKTKPKRDSAPFWFWFWFTISTGFTFLGRWCMWHSM